MKYQLEILHSKYQKFFEYQEYDKLINDFNKLNPRLKKTLINNNLFSDLIFECLLKMGMKIDNPFISYYVLFRKEINSDLLHDFIVMNSKSVHSDKNENPFIDNIFIIKLIISKRQNFLDLFAISKLGDNNFDASPQIKKYLPRFSSDNFWILTYIIIGYFISTPIPFLFETLFCLCFFFFLWPILAFYFKPFQVYYYKYFLFKMYSFYYIKKLLFSIRKKIPINYDKKSNVKFN